MKIEKILQDETYFESIKECSLDDRDNSSKEYMCDIDKKIINFDKLKEDYAKKRNNNVKPNNMMKSNDGLYIEGTSYYFIEFKNGKLIDSNNKRDKNKIRDIRLKIADSSLILSDITEMPIEKMRQNVEYILVYNGDRNNMVGKGHEVHGRGAAMIGKSLMNLTQKKKFIQFGLENYIGWLFKDVDTVTSKEFEKKYSFIGN